MDGCCGEERFKAWTNGKDCIKKRFRLLIGLSIWSWHGSERVSRSFEQDGTGTTKGFDQHNELASQEPEPKVEITETQMSEATDRALAAAGLSDLFDDEEAFLMSRSQCEQNNEDLGIVDLHGKKPPQHTIQSERFWHRQVAFMIATGMSQTEVARELGKTNGWISQVVRQPWFSALVLKELHRSGRNAVEEIFKNAAPASALKLIELRDDEKTPAAVKLNASRELLDRYMGKAPITVNHNDRGVSSDPVAEAEKLKQEINELASR